MVAVARWAGLIISRTADFLGFSYTTHLEFTQTGAKEKKKEKKKPPKHLASSSSVGGNALWPDWFKLTGSLC